jgi:hypothetical protein
MGLLCLGCIWSCGEEHSTQAAIENTNAIYSHSNGLMTNWDILEPSPVELMEYSSGELKASSDVVLDKSFKVASAVFSAFGYDTKEQQTKYQVYHFGVVLSDLPAISERLYSGDFCNGRLIALDLLVGEEADPLVQHFLHLPPVIDGDYNLNISASHMEHERWGYGVVKAFNASCEPEHTGKDGIKIIAGLARIKRFQSIMGFYAPILHYHFTLENGEVIQGEARLTKSPWPSHIHNMRYLHCSVLPKTVKN